MRIALLVAIIVLAVLLLGPKLGVRWPDMNTFWGKRAYQGQAHLGDAVQESVKRSADRLDR